MSDKKTWFRPGTRVVWIALGISTVAAAALAGCSVGGLGGSDEASSGEGDGDYGDGDATGDGDGDLSIGPDGDAGDIGFGGDGNIPDLPPLPEEVEDDSAYRAPVATGRYLWSANPESGRVALIDVENLTAEVLPAGLGPTFLTSVGNPDEPRALVINTGSSDVSRFRVQSGGEVLIDKVATHTGANRWSSSASGKWAVVWSRPEPGQKLDPTEGLQEITVLALGEEKMTATRVTVGYRPSQVVVSDDDTRLVVVSEEGITLIDLTATPVPYEYISLGFDAENRDVSVNQTGTHALVRRTDESVVELIDLLDPQNISQITFAAAVTDLDLADSGRAVAVIRSRSEVGTFTIEDVVADPSDIQIKNIPGEIFGSAVLTEDGETAVLYTNAIENPRISVVDFRAGSFLDVRSLSTKAPVYSVIAAPNGEHAAVIAGDTSPQLGEVGIPADAFSVVALRAERFPRVVGTGAPVLNVALGNDFGIITASNAGQNIFEAYLVELPGLSVEEHLLATQPLAAGILADSNLAYAAQAHPEGRVTFFDFDADQSRTLTGFELSAEVVDE